MKTHWLFILFFTRLALILNYYCPLNRKAVSPTSWKPEVGFAFYIGQAPTLVKIGLLRRRFRYLGKHFVQVCVRLVEKFFKIEVIHKYNPHHRGQPGETPSPFQCTLE